MSRAQTRQCEQCWSCNRMCKLKQYYDYHSPTWVSAGKKFGRIDKLDKPRSEGTNTTAIFTTESIMLSTGCVKLYFIPSSHQSSLDDLYTAIQYTDWYRLSENFHVKLKCLGNAKHLERWSLHRRCSYFLIGSFKCSWKIFQRCDWSIRILYCSTSFASVVCTEIRSTVCTLDIVVYASTQLEDHNVCSPRVSTGLFDISAWICAG